MSKFFPSYQLFIETQDGEMISLPEEYANDREFACKFTVTQTTTSTPQNATINIYNLSDTNRKRLFFNWFDQVSVMKKVALYAGYNEEKHLIFDGVQQEVSTYREGASLVTEIHGTCLGYAINGYEANAEATSSYVRSKGVDDNGQYEDLTFDELINQRTDPFLTEEKFQFAAGATRAEVIAGLAKTFSDTQEENGLSGRVEMLITNDEWLEKKFNKPVTLIGNVVDLIKQYVPPNTNVWYFNDTLYVVSTDVPISKNFEARERQSNLIRFYKARNRRDSKKDNNKFQVLKATAAQSTGSSSDVLIINADTGLLNTPRFYGQSMQLTTLFEPRINCGDLVRLESAVQPEFNRDYKVCGVTHSCEMGFGTSGSNITSLTLVYPNSNYMDVGYTL